MQESVNKEFEFGLCNLTLLSCKTYLLLKKNYSLVNIGRSLATYVNLVLHLSFLPIYSAFSCIVVWCDLSFMVCITELKHK